MNQKLAGVNKDYGINQKLNVHKHVFNFYSLELRRKSNSLKKKKKKKVFYSIDTLLACFSVWNHKICVACKSDQLSKLCLMVNGFICSISNVCIHSLILQRWPLPGTTCTSHKRHGISNHLTLLLKEMWAWRQQGDGSAPKTFALSSTRTTASSYVRFVLFNFYLFTFINTLEHQNITHKLHTPVTQWGKH